MSPITQRAETGHTTSGPPDGRTAVWPCEAPLDMRLAVPLPGPQQAAQQRYADRLSRARRSNSERRLSERVGAERLARSPGSPGFAVWPCELLEIAPLLTTPAQQRYEDRLSRARKGNSTRRLRLTPDDASARDPRRREAF